MTDPTPDPDRRLDERLTAAGAHWRAAQPAPPEPDPARLARPHRSRWQPLAAAAAVVAVAAGGVAAVAVSRRTADPAAAGRVAGQTVAPADGTVQDGELVNGQGTVVARHGRPVELCLPEARVSVYPEMPPSCRVGVTVTDLDLDRISDRQDRYGTVWGTAWVEGVYRAGTLTVSRQEAYRNPPRSDAGAADTVPCPEPAGGWPRQPGNMTAAVSRLTRAVATHAEEYTDPYVRYPYGWHLQDTSDRKGTEVYVVGTTGDVAAARRELERVFPARHLCVTRAVWSRAAMLAAERALLTPAAVAAGIGSPRREVLQDRVTATVVVLDADARRFLAGVAEGRVVPEPMLAEAR